MACTIVSTPATGATDWTDWITQQGLTDRGFSRVSLTNFAGTAASAIGTGSVFELAGSIYNNTTETAISLATATASAAVAVYIMAIPAAGGTTCTFELNSIAPIWVDAKQGFYASAASTTRAIGGLYIGTASTYYTKFLYTQDMLTGYLLPMGETRPMLKKVVEIGDWDMGTAASVVVAHDLGNWTGIRSVNVTIRNDSVNAYDDLNQFTDAADPDLLGGGVTAINATNITIRRRTSGQFDGAAFDSTSFNRGWIVIDFEA